MESELVMFPAQSVRHRMAEEGGAAPEDSEDPQQLLPPSVEDMLNQTLDQLKML